MSSVALGQQLEQLFQQQINAAAELLQLLQDENQALIQRDYERSTQLTQLKQVKSTEIDRLSNLLIKLCSTTQTPYSHNVLDKLIKELPAQPGNSLKQLRSKLEQVTLACQDQNVINGQIIAVNKQSAETALAILRGQFSTSELTYGAGGQPIKDKSAQQITKAWWLQSIVCTLDSKLAPH